MSIVSEARRANPSLLCCACKATLGAIGEYVPVEFICDGCGSEAGCACKVPMLDDLQRRVCKTAMAKLAARPNESEGPKEQDTK